MKKIFPVCIVLSVLAGISVNLSAEEPPRLEMNTAHRIDYWSYSADGRLLVTGSGSREICVYDADSMRFLRNFPAKNLHNGALLPDGSGICFNDSQGIRTVSLRDGTSTVFPSPGFAGLFTGFALSPDGKKIAAADDQRIMIFSYPDGKLLSETKKNGHPVRSARFSPDGSQLALVSGKNSETLLLYSLKDSTLTELGGLFSGHGYIIDDLCFSEDGRYLASGGMDCRAIVWDLSSMSQKAVFKLEKEEYINAVYMRSAETPLLFISFNGMFCKGDISSGKIISKTKITVPPNVYTDSRSIIGDFMFNPDGSRFCLKSGVPVLFRTDDLSCLSPGSMEMDQIDFCSVNGDGSTLMFGRYGETGLVDTRTGAYKKSSRLSNWKTFYACNSDMSIQAGLTYFNNFEIYSVPKKSSIHKIQDKREMSRVCITEDGSFLAGVVQEGYEKVHAIRIACSTGDTKDLVIKVVTPGYLSVGEIKLSPDGRFAVLTSTSSCCFAADFKTGRVAECSARDGSSDIIFSGGDAGLFKDSDFLRAFPAVATIQNATPPRIFNFVSGRVMELKNNDAYCYSLTPDRKKIMIGFMTGIIQVYDIASMSMTGTVILGAKGYGAIHPDGRYYGSSPEVLSALHWVVGDEAVPLQQFGQQFYAPGILTEIFTGKAGSGEARRAKPPVSVQRQLIGKVFAIEGDSVIVASSVSGSLVRGKKLMVMPDGGGTIVLTISMPMHTSAKCSIGDASKKKMIRRGMPVFKE